MQLRPTSHLKSAGYLNIRRPSTFNSWGSGTQSARSAYHLETFQSWGRQICSSLTPVCAIQISLPFTLSPSMSIGKPLHRRFGPSILRNGLRLRTEHSLKSSSDGLSALMPMWVADVRVIRWRKHPLNGLWTKLLLTAWHSGAISISTCCHHRLPFPTRTQSLCMEHTSY